MYGHIHFCVVIREQVSCANKCRVYKLMFEIKHFRA